MKKLLFIYNPLAGKGAIQGKLPAMLDTFTKAGWLTTAYPTQCKGDAARVAALLGGQFDRVVCCGGDGTLSQAISGMLAVERPPALGWVPAGTTNDFARSLGLPQNLLQAARVAVTGPVRRCDTGLFNHGSFIYVAAFGAFTDVSYDTPQRAKQAFGHLAYVLAGVSRLGSLKSCRLEVVHDGGVVRGDFSYGMVSNTVSVGGFKGLHADQVKLDDGLFEVVLVRRPQNPAQLRSIINSLVQHKPVPGGAVVCFRTARAVISCQQEVPWTLDGEYGGSHKRVEIENYPRSVSLVWGRRGGSDRGQN